MADLAIGAIAVVGWYTRSTPSPSSSGDGGSFVRDRAIANRLLSAEQFDEGIAALEQTATPEGVFCYTSFKGVSRTESRSQT
jgi:hypothetical protein